MADRTAIEWTQATWNPDTGCDRTSPGCDNCYALTLAKRLKAMGNPKYQWTDTPHVRAGLRLTVTQDEAAGLTPDLRQPRVVFVNSMSDLFHPAVPEEFIPRSSPSCGTPPTTPSRYSPSVQRLRRMAEQLGVAPNVWMGVSVENARYRSGSTICGTVPQGQVPLRRATNRPRRRPRPQGVHWVIVGGESGLGPGRLRWPG